MREQNQNQWPSLKEWLLINVISLVCIGIAVEIIKGIEYAGCHKLLGIL